MSNREFREFWIDDFLKEYSIEKPLIEIESDPKVFHVIEYAALIEANRKLEIAREALETIAKTEKPIYPHSMSSTSRFNMAIASQALEEIK